MVKARLQVGAEAAAARLCGWVGAQQRQRTRAAGRALGGVAVPLGADGERTPTAWRLTTASVSCVPAGDWASVHAQAAEPAEGHV